MTVSTVNNIMPWQLVGINFCCASRSLTSMYIIARTVVVYKNFRPVQKKCAQKWYSILWFCECFVMWTPNAFHMRVKCGDTFRILQEFKWGCKNQIHFDGGNKTNIFHQLSQWCGGTMRANEINKIFLSFGWIKALCSYTLTENGQTTQTLSWAGTAASCVYAILKMTWFVFFSILLGCWGWLLPLLAFNLDLWDCLPAGCIDCWESKSYLWSFAKLVLFCRILF